MKIITGEPPSDLDMKLFRQVNCLIEDEKDDELLLIKDDDHGLPVNLMKDPVLSVVIARRKTRLALRLIEKMDASRLKNNNYFEDTALHVAATVGDCQVAKALLNRDPSLVRETNKKRETPLHKAALYGQRNMFWCLLEGSREEDRNLCSSMRREDGANVLHCAITGNAPGLALEIAREFPGLITSRNDIAVTPLQLMVTIPEAFRSQLVLGPLDELLYKCIPVQSDDSAHTGRDEEKAHPASTKPLRSKFPSQYDVLFDLFELVFHYAVSSRVQDLEKKKNLHRQVMDLVEHLALHPNYFDFVTKGRTPGGMPSHGSLEDGQFVERSVPRENPSLFSEFVEKSVPREKPSLFSDFVEELSQFPDKFLKNVGLREDDKPEPAEAKPKDGEMFGRVWKWLPAKVRHRILVVWKIADKLSQFRDNLLTIVGQLEDDTSELAEAKRNVKEMIGSGRELFEWLTAKEPDRRWDEPPLTLGARMGLDEYVIKIIETYPQSATLCDAEGRSVLQVAIMHGRSRIVQFIKKKFQEKNPILPSWLLSSVDRKTGNTILHIASEKLIGEDEDDALKLHEELKWFELIKEMVPKELLNSRNAHDKTAQEAFTENHKEMLRNCKSKLIATGTACSALAAAVVFASSFSIPDDKDSGELAGTLSFKIFSHAYPIGVSCAATSLMLFMSLLISPYEERQFLRTIPTKFFFAVFSFVMAMAALLLSFTCSVFLQLYGPKTTTKEAVAIGLEFTVFPIAISLVLLYRGSTFGVPSFRVLWD